MIASIGRAFMEKTQYRYLEATDQQKGLPQPPLELKPLRDVMETVDLPPPPTIRLGEIPLRGAIEARKSLRQHAEASLSLEELSYLLWCTQGIKEVIPGKATFRTVPSAGARHPFETVLLVNRVKGLQPGLYWFLASGHRLARLTAQPGIVDQITQACLNQTFIATSAVTFIWVADTYRTTWRYGERGYRYMHLDAGHACQNLYLTAESIGAGACAIGAFSDEAMNALLELDGAKRFVIYLAAVGKRSSTP